MELGITVPENKVQFLYSQTTYLRAALYLFQVSLVLNPFPLE
jgi:hypothetical protein